MEQPLLKRLIDAFTCLPGVGQKTAQRFSCYLLERDRDGAAFLWETLQESLDRIRRCDRCRMFTEEEVCSICRDQSRDASLVCVVENPAGFIALEATTGFKGKYFVLHGKLSPLDGIGPDEIGLDLLETRLGGGEIKELILATGTTVEGDVTAHLISELAAKYNVASSRLAQGVPAGGELEFIDATTLAQAFEARRRY